VGKVAVIGFAAYSGVVTGGGGSGSVAPYYQVTPLQGIAERLGLEWPQRPQNCQIEENVIYLRVDPNSAQASASSADECCALCAARYDCNVWSFGQGSCNFGLEPILHIHDKNYVSGTCSPLQLPNGILYDDGTNLTSAAEVAAQADVVIAVVATTSSEGHDRPNLSFNGENRGDLAFWQNQDAMVSAVAAANPNTIVVCINPGAVLTPWSEEVQAVVAMFMPGQEEGHALADVLFGDVDPGGRLPVTFPNIENEVRFTPQQYPGLPIYNPLNAEYSEMLEIGYRWYQSHNVQPKFAFGHGLSYSTYSYSGLSVSGRNVSFSVTNTGSRTGYEVPQMYLRFPESAGEPPLQLKGFTKLNLTAGETASVTFTVRDRDLSIWDVNAKAFVPQTGLFGVFVGASSEDMRLFGTLTN